MSALARRALASLDLTDLSDACTFEAAANLVARARTIHGPVAAVCLWPQYVSMARERLRGSGVAVATVINFPAGGEDIERVVDDIHEALRDGADEIDLVIPWRALKRGDERLARDMIGAARDAIPSGRRLKTILETGELGDPNLIARASDIAARARNMAAGNLRQLSLPASPAACASWTEKLMRRTASPRRCVS